MYDERGILLAARALVEVAAGLAREWFLELEAHPERYRFQSHAGFVFTHGTFGVVGSRFETRERFYGILVRLGFELTEVRETLFSFRLIRPSLPMWGAFLIEDAGNGHSLLSLVVGARSRLGRLFVRLPLVRGAIQHQIQREVDHISSSIEASFAPSTP